MLENNKIIKVTNRFNGSVGYSIQDLNNLHRVFSPGETKEITMEELRKLAWEPGGETLINDYLVIQDNEAIKEILHQVEPEYYYTEKDVKDLLLNRSLDALKDCLDFAPEGTKDLVKKMAVELPLNDISKRKAILEMTGFNVDNAIKINEESAEDSKNDNEKTRRLTEKEENKEIKPAGRRVVISDDKYKVIK